MHALRTFFGDESGHPSFIVTRQVRSEVSRLLSGNACKLAIIAPGLIAG